MWRIMFDRSRARLEVKRSGSEREIERGSWVLIRGAIILGILFLCGWQEAAGQERIAPPGVVKAEPPFRKRMYTDKTGAKMPYRLFIPPQYQAEHEAGQKYPLIFFFHGGSGRGSDNEAQIAEQNEKGSHVWTTGENQARLPAFVLAPQCAKNENWSDPDLNQVNAGLQMAVDILAVVEKDYAIDRDRVYLVGQSMGGLAVWTLLQKYPQRWAGAVVAGSYDNFTEAKALTKVPLWIFQWERDPAVPVELIREMVKELKKAGGAPRYTEYRKVHKEVWDEAFGEPQLVEWVAAQKRLAGGEAVKEEK